MSEADRRFPSSTNDLVVLSNTIYYLLGTRDPHEVSAWITEAKDLAKRVAPGHSPGHPEKPSETSNE